MPNARPLVNFTTYILLTELELAVIIEIRTAGMLDLVCNIVAKQPGRVNENRVGFNTEFTASFLPCTMFERAILMG